MKKLLQFVAVAMVATFVPLTVSVPVSAQEAPNCEIGETGSGSENECEIEYTCTIDIDNNNNVIITNSNQQTAGSGSATVKEDGTGGGAISGSAENGSSVTFNVVIDNSNKENPCVVQSVVPTPETPEPETPEVPAQPTQNVTPKALPVTNGALPVALLSLGGLGVVVGAAVASRRLFL